MWTYERDVYLTSSGGAEERYALFDPDGEPFATCETEAAAEHLVAVLNLGERAAGRVILDWDAQAADAAAMQLGHGQDAACWATIHAAAPF